MRLNAIALDTKKATGKYPTRSATSIHVGIGIIAALAAPPIVNQMPIAQPGIVALIMETERSHSNRIGANCMAKKAPNPVPNQCESNTATFGPRPSESMNIRSASGSS